MADEKKTGAPEGAHDARREEDSLVPEAAEIMNDAANGNEAEAQAADIEADLRRELEDMRAQMLRALAENRAV